MRASGQAGGMENTQGRDPVTAPQGTQGLLRDKEINNNHDGRRRRKEGERIGGEGEGEKKLLLFHLSRKKMSFNIRQTQFPILGFLLTKSGTFIQINVSGS